MRAPTFRLFLSSPGDAAIERRRVAAVVSRINGECAGRARIETIRWETESYQAHSTFQSQIPQAVECDLVLTIFRWRLGTELPPDFPDRMPTGEPYPSGTAYELLTSIERRRGGAESPDVFVYRYGGSSPRPEIDDPDRERIERDWSRLKGFFERFFLTPDGHFKAAYQTYASEDDLEAQLDALLRRWLSDKIAAGRILAWPDAIKGSPFPGLQAYGRRHATVFFGRDRDVARAVELWSEAAGGGTPFLLVVGSSGAGKSSLVRAGLVPRVTTPGVVEAVDLWRVATLRPADSPDGPLAALAAALLLSAPELPPEEEGRGPALPELAGGLRGGRAELASLLAADAAGSAGRVVAVLDRIGAGAQADERRERAVRADLVLVVDQLDELFAPSLPEAARDAFVAALAALAATGRVWVAATLRADLYAAMLDHPGLKALKAKGAAYDLAPPGPAELAEIVRRPAEAADLAFGRDPGTGEGVDERLLREADRPDMLPLVQLALARLYEGRRHEDDRTILPFEVYAGLGGLTGIIDEVAERALAGLPPDSVRALPQLTRSLAQAETEGPLAGTLTVTPVRLAEAAPDEPRRRLVDALVAARLLTVAESGQGGLVRLAHQRVLTDWARTREIVAGSADFYRVRAEVERRRSRWDANRRADLLLPRGLPLAEAENIAARYPDEIPPETRAYVRASRARAGRTQMLLGAAAIVFAFVAAGALYGGWVAREQTRLAERNFGIAREAVRDVVFNIVQGLSDVSGMRLDALTTILTTVQGASDKLALTAPGDPELLRTRAAMFDNFSRMYRAAGDTKGARLAAEQAVALLRRRLALVPDDPRAEGDLSVPLVTLGDAVQVEGDLSGAVRLFEDALARARAGAARRPDDPEIRLRVAPPLNRLGGARFAAGDVEGALALYREFLAISRRELAADPSNPERQAVVAIALSDLAFVDRENGDLDTAQTGYDEAFAISRDLAAAYPANPSRQHSLVIALTNLGELDVKAGRKREAVVRLDEALRREREIFRGDPENRIRQRTLAVTLEKRGSGAFALADWPGALAFYGESLELLRGIVARNPYDLDAQGALSTELQNTGSTRNRAGDLPAARRDFEERLAVSRALASRQPGNAQSQRAFVIALRDLADLRGAADLAAALALYREALPVAAAQSRLDPASLPPLDLYVEILDGLAALERTAEDYEASFRTDDDLVRALRRLVELRPGQAERKRTLAGALMRSGVQRASLRRIPDGFRLIDESLGVLRDLAGSRDRSDRINLAKGLTFKGKVAAQLGLRPVAFRAFGEALGIRRALAAEGGTALDRVEVARSLYFLSFAVDEPNEPLADAMAVLDGLPEADRTEDVAELRSSIVALLPARTSAPR